MLWSGFVFGLLGSFHCIGMCGPIAFALPVSRTNRVKKISQIFLYHLGRIITYSLIGLSLGWVGKSLYIYDVQQQTSIVIGIILILSVLLPVRFLDRLQLFKPIYFFLMKVKSLLGKSLKKKTPDTFLVIGLLNGFLPCGLVSIAAFTSLSSSRLLEGALYMFSFGLGTVPMMTLAVYLGKFINVKIKRYIQKAIPVFIVITGLLFILRGMGLGISFLSPPEPIEIISGEVDCVN